MERRRPVKSRSTDSGLLERGSVGPMEDKRDWNKLETNVKLYQHTMLCPRVDRVSFVNENVTLFQISKQYYINEIK